MKLSKVIAALEDIASPSLAAEWDNVGLLIEPNRDKQVKSLLLTIDTTDAVVGEAMSKRCQLIVSYHPLLFDPVQRLVQDYEATRLAMRLSTAGIALYSPHTALDALPGGVNDWLVDGLGSGKRRGIAPLFPEDELCAHGRLLTLDRPATVDDIIRRAKKHLGLKHLRVAKSPSHRSAKAKVRSIAVCAGAGYSVLEEAEADVFLSGEMRHHDVLSANARGTSVILCEHTNTERGYLPHYRRALKRVLGKAVQVAISRKDAEPLEVR